MGHTTRMIPVAAMLMKEGNEVTFGVSSRQAALLKADLPGAEIIDFPGFTTRYSRFLPMYLHFAFRIPAFIASVAAEHRRLKRLLPGSGFNMVISDNRMGLWNRSVKTVYYTHMIRIPMPALLKFLEPPMVLLHRLFIEKFDECRIPDIAGRGNMSGRLSHGVRLPRNAHYTGILSKYSLCSAGAIVFPAGLSDIEGKPYSLLILSGPEPQKSLMRIKIILLKENSNETLVIMEGDAGHSKAITRYNNIISVPHLPPCSMAALITCSREIISRSGYTTIMELASLDRLNENTVLIPTPGQTEQEYLASYHHFRTVP